MSKLIRILPTPRKGLQDPRSTGAAAPLRLPDIHAARGTFKGRP